MVGVVRAVTPGSRPVLGTGAALRLGAQSIQNPVNDFTGCGVDRYAADVHAAVGSDEQIGLERGWITVVFLDEHAGTRCRVCAVDFGIRRDRDLLGLSTDYLGVGEWQDVPQVDAEVRCGEPSVGAEQLVMRTSVALAGMVRGK